VFILQVLRYLQAFAEHYHLHQLIRFSTHVLQAVPVGATAAAGSANAPGLHAAAPASQQHGQTLQQQQQHQQQQQQQQPSAQESSAALPWQRWQVTWQELPPQATAGHCAGHTADSDAAGTPAAAAAAADVSATATPPHTELFDAVLVCNGHYTEPRLPDIPGASVFPGVLMHSHSYREPARFTGQHVAVIGASYSGGTDCEQLTFPLTLSSGIQYAKGSLVHQHVQSCFIGLQYSSLLETWQIQHGVC
jgi:hypothetical protein